MYDSQLVQVRERTVRTNERTKDGTSIFPSHTLSLSLSLSGRRRACSIIYLSAISFTAALEQSRYRPVRIVVCSGERHIDIGWLAGGGGHLLSLYRPRLSLAVTSVRSIYSVCMCVCVCLTQLTLWRSTVCDSTVWYGVPATVFIVARPRYYTNGNTRAAPTTWLLYGLNIKINTGITYS